MLKIKYFAQFYIIVVLGCFTINGQELFREVEGGKLFGKLELNQNKKNNALIFFIQGSGPTDLNGNSSYLNCNNYKLLSDGLQQLGYSTFRFDKRGIGKSNFKHIDESQMTIDLLVDDAVNWITYLKKYNKTLPKIYLLGHSEGSLIAALVSKKIKVAGVISIAGFGSKPSEILKSQFLKIDNDKHSKALEIIDSLDNNHQVKNVPLSLYPIFRPSVQPYLLSWFKYTPWKVYKDLNTRAMIIHGGSDFQISVDESLVLANNRIKRVVIPKMNHLMKTVVNEDENKDSYTNPDYKISSQLIFQINKFIKK